MLSWIMRSLVQPVVRTHFIASRNISMSQVVLLKNYYAILGLDRNCDPKEIRPKYMELCKLHHPDTITSGSEKEVQEKKNLFQDINEAYTQLSRKETRIEHDYELELEEEEKRVKNNMYRYSGLNYEYAPQWRVYNEDIDMFWKTSWQDDFLKEEKRRMKQKQKDRKRRRAAEREKREKEEEGKMDDLYEYYREETEYHKKMVKRMERQAHQAASRGRPDIVNLWNQTLNMYDDSVLRPNDHLHTYPDEERRIKRSKKTRRKSKYFTLDD